MGKTIFIPAGEEDDGMQREPETLLLLQRRGVGRPRKKKVTSPESHDEGKPERIEKRKRREKAIVEGPDCNINISALRRAEEIESSLPLKFPTHLKPMLPSHVAGCFWLGLPKKFCTLHLPKHDATIILEDESGGNYETRYLWEKSGLSGGWRSFSINHGLQAGDIVVFQLVKPTKFKVYIVRSSGSSKVEVDEALGLLELDPSSKKAFHGKEVSLYLPKVSPGKAEECGMHRKPPTEDILKANTSADDLRIREADHCLPMDQPEHEPGDTSAEVLDAIKFSESVLDFKDMTSMEDIAAQDFPIVVSGLDIAPELPKHLRKKYYELCRSQKSLLHEKLLGGLNCKLAAGIVSETLNIADAIRSSKITTSLQNFITWGKTLKAFKDLGMEVGFLQARLDQLVHLATKSKRITELRRERDLAAEEKSILEAKIAEAKKRIDKLDAEMKVLEVLDMNDRGLDDMFHEVSNAPW